MLVEGTSCFVSFYAEVTETLMIDAGIWGGVDRRAGGDEMRSASKPWQERQR